MAEYDGASERHLCIEFFLCLIVHLICDGLSPEDADDQSPTRSRVEEWGYYQLKGDLGEYAVECL
jgi:hypothetical protein